MRIIWLINGLCRGATPQPEVSKHHEQTEGTTDWIEI